MGGSGFASNRYTGKAASTLCRVWRERQCMASQAVRFLGIDRALSSAAQLVDLRCDLFQVFRIHAVFYAAQVVNLQSVNEWADKSLIHQAMHKWMPFAAPSALNNGIASAIHGRCPDPTSGNLALHNFGRDSIPYIAHGYIAGYHGV